MDRLLNGLAYLAAIVGVLYALFSYARFPENEVVRRPPVSYAEGEYLDVGTFTIDLSPQQPSIGTAFAIGGGWWAKPDAASGREYYVHETTGECTWDPPGSG